MGYTKGQQRLLDDIHAKIMDGKRRGVCNGDGESVKRNGVFVAKPKNYGRPTQRWVKGMGWVDV